MKNKMNINLSIEKIFIYTFTHKVYNNIPTNDNL